MPKTIVKPRGSAAALTIATAVAIDKVDRWSCCPKMGGVLSAEESI